MDERFEETQQSNRKLYRKGLLHGVLISVLVWILLISLTIFGMYHTGILTLQGRYPSSSKVGNTGNASGAVDSPDSGVLDLTEAQLAKAETLLTMLEQYYCEEISSDDMADSIYHAVIEGSGDKYSQYFSEEELKSFNNYTDNTYYGIGVTFLMDDDGKGLIRSIFSDSPAEEAGIQEGDRIIAVNAESIIGYESTDVANLIRGEEGSYVTLTIERDGETLELNVERRNVQVDTVGYMMIDGIMYIQVIKFGDKTDTEFEAAIQAAKEENAKGIIVDLRDNTGGRVDSVVAMMDQVFGEGVTLSMQSSDGRKEYTSDEEHKIDCPMVVVINGNSASASEIFAAAAKDFETGALVGTKSYGKGVYQNVYSLADGSAVKITTGKFYSPKGNNYNEEGITPDYEVEYEYLEDEEVVYGYERDSQLSKAFEVMKELIGE